MATRDNVNMIFSIICTIYNKELYLEKTIESVMNQSYSNFELILVDDGSTDSSASIAIKKAQKYQNIFFLSCKNAGPMASRLLGLAKATGDYCLFLDADDTYSHNALETLLSFINKYEKPDLIRFRNTFIDKDDNFIRGRGSNYFYFYDEELITSETIYKEMLIKEKINYITHICFKRTIFPLPYYFKNINECWVSEDLIMQLPLTDNAEKILCIDNRLYNYRITPNSIIQSDLNIDYLYKKNNRYLLGILLGYCDKWKLNDNIKNDIYINNIKNTVNVFISALHNNKWAKIRKTIKNDLWIEPTTDIEAIKSLNKKKLPKHYKSVFIHIMRKNTASLFNVYIKTQIKRLIFFLIFPNKERK